MKPQIVSEVMIQDGLSFIPRMNGNEIEIKESLCIEAKKAMLDISVIHLNANTNIEKKEREQNKLQEYYK